MKRPTWNSKGVLWDAYNRPHNVVDSRFILFDTGEITLRSRFFSHNNRRTYPEIGLIVCNSAKVHEEVNMIPPSGSMSNRTYTGEGGTSIITPDGNRVLMAHLMNNITGNTEQQTFCIDPVRREIFYICEGYKDTAENRLKNVPEMFNNKGLYWPTAEDRAVCNPTRVVRPRRLDKELKARKEEAEVLCKATAQLREVGGWTVDTNTYKVIDNIFETDDNLIDIVSCMTDNEVGYFAEHGIPAKKQEFVPYLKF